MTLSKYKQKRNFKQTPEPAGKVGGKRSKLKFVIQKHDASRLHYDFRLEMEGVLKSWAVPKGPSMNPGDKRLAVMVEDHPLAYGKFRGVIPEGNYGAGDVEIWDEGYYTALEKPEKLLEEKHLLKQLHEGNLKFTLHGKQLNGSFALVKMKDASQENQWLLIKKDDEHAVTKKYDSNNIDPIKPLKRKTKAAKPKIPAKKATTRKKPVKKKAKPDLSLLTRPMLAKTSEAPDNETDYAFEYKWDGYRCITTIINNEVNLYSRNGILFNTTFAPIASAFEKVMDNVVLDGEIVAVNKQGVPQFQLLQNNRAADTQLRYYLFDILYLNGEVITTLPFLQRNELLNLFFRKYHFKNVFISKLLSGKWETLLKDAAKKGLEGIIAKRVDSSYSPGRRTPAWLKLKIFNTQSAIICGFTAPQGSRARFGSLILGVYENNTLQYIGHCGSGFTEKSLHDLYQKMRPFITKQCPFSTIPETNQPTTWLKPQLICEVKFTEWTVDNVLRHPVFRGLRNDLKTKDIGKEPAKSHPMAIQKKSPETKKKTTEGNELLVGGKRVAVTNLNKIYWPKDDYTKGDMISYYAKAAEYIFPFLKDRPMSMNRFPNGIDKPSFYQKDVEVTQVPPWVATEPIYSESNDKNVDYIVCKNEATIVYMANLGCIELNPWNSRLGHLDEPDYIVIDLDPGEIEFSYVVKTALETKKVCDEFGISSYCKTSGATGLHIYIPLHAKYNYDLARQFANLLAQIIHEHIPEFTSIERAVSKRRRKIYIDFLQNSRGQTLASVFSVRPRPGATVSTPLEWKEVNARLDPKKFTIKNTLRSIRQRTELFMPVLKETNSIKKILAAMGA